MADPTAPAELDLTIYQGQDWSLILELFTNETQTAYFDLTGCEVDLHIREGVADSLAELKIAASTRATGDGAGRITVISRTSAGDPDELGGADPTDGCILLSIPAAVSSAVAPTKKVRAGSHEVVEFLYDLEIESSTGKITRAMTGVVNFDLEVTRRS